MKCIQCGSQNVDALITVKMRIDANDYWHITKKVIAKKSTAIEDLKPEKTIFSCRDCGYQY